MAKIYLVGGAVRDQLLGLPIKEKDWVVVGATADELIKKGFRPVGKDFPVFLHPETHEEYALARTERKMGTGYKGFTFYTAKTVTLEEDLKRRDLTINAIAQDDQGQLIDPFGGQKDLQAKCLRHVSPAFAEDPVRVLRIARFAARFGQFKVAKETLALMKNMAASGELTHLVPERVFQELDRALGEKYPWRFFEVLRRCGALKVIFPEIDALFYIPEPIEWHLEKNAGKHLLLALKQASRLTKDPLVRFAVVVHDFGKILSPQSMWPKHHRHEERGVAVVKNFCTRLRAPRAYEDLALLVTRYHMLCHQIFKLRPITILKLLQALDPFRKPARFEQFLLACQSDEQGRQGTAKTPYPQADFLRNIYQQCTAIDIKTLIKNKKPHQSIPKLIAKKRLSIIASVQRT
ncbi:MAG: multifunctional CCA tRNA nucleotidyl transferase/2'3'-cyclic phosphodiesterase/2'nucleotidase/phosphatase [Gammaproteobacteria bacterium GWF2_41_13]|nr:MAG: multifunctional CCA tRNA nucleotidyl transferase/2'3'-cyclic phosphodiesterase/2'nucleotidase/phosphatase [Gammaproteobacteria bacterium GWF2_41_13]